VTSKAPALFETDRLLLRRPQPRDAAHVFERFASDPSVTQYVGWPRHTSIADTEAFLTFCDAEWDRWPAGPYLVLSRNGSALLGSSGLSFETPYRAATGYVFALDAWGHGYATETLMAMVTLAPALGIQRLYALCHTAHRASWRVLEKCGFDREGILHRYAEFPNLNPGSPEDVFCYAMVDFTRRHAGGTHGER
jgi:ribosomal-protein-alanine N-acetyltransferase